MKNALAKLKDACAAKTEIAKQEIVFWQRLSEAIEHSLSFRQMPTEQKRVDVPPPPPKLFPKNTYLCSKLAAEYLGISNGTLDKWRCVGGGPKFVKIGRSVRYRYQDLEAFVNENSFPHTSAYARNNN